MTIITGHVDKWMVSQIITHPHHVQSLECNNGLDKANKTLLRRRHRTNLRAEHNYQTIVVASMNQRHEEESPFLCSHNLTTPSEFHNSVSKNSTMAR